jgi:riboflavin kinase/FMN adenylyltransferase
MSFATLQWEEMPPASFQGGAIAIGNFDGVHRGHLALLAELRRCVDQVGGPAVAVTFDPHPLQLLRPREFQPLLTTILDRADLLQANGADNVLVLRTSPKMLALSAAEFFEEVVRRRLAGRVQVEGPNFGFGRNREGTVEMLADFCRQAGMELVIVPPLNLQGSIVASSRIRQALLRGAVREGAELLGRPYRLRGRVVRGNQRGQTLGFPTANLEQPEMLVPGDGVYAVRVLHAEKTWPGAANIGPNPTFGEAGRKIEVHLIGYQGDLLGQVLQVDFLDRLRETRTFAGPTELVEQLRRDVQQAHRISDPLSSKDQA